jgi:acetoin utilization deacetylase AcuC-like enzyme
VNAALVFSPDYDISLPGLDWLHPFDGRKFSRALGAVGQALQIPLKARTADDAYLATVREDLPSFLASMPRKPALAIYNAGTDVLAGDPVGRLSVSVEGVVARDAMVLDTLSGQGIPTVIVTSGGYSSNSYELIAQLAHRVMQPQQVPA